MSILVAIAVGHEEVPGYSTPRERAENSCSTRLTTPPPSGGTGNRREIEGYAEAKCGRFLTLPLAGVEPKTCALRTERPDGASHVGGVRNLDDEATLASQDRGSFRPSGTRDLYPAVVAASGALVVVLTGPLTEEDPVAPELAGLGL